MRRLQTHDAPARNPNVALALRKAPRARCRAIVCACCATRNRPRGLKELKAIGSFFSVAYPADFGGLMGLGRGVDARIRKRPHSSPD